MTAFFHSSGTGPGGTSVASRSVADRALVSNAATISDGGASASNVYSSSKVDSLLNLVEAGISYKEACIAATTAPLPTCQYTIGPPGELKGLVNGALPVIGGVAVLVGDRILVVYESVGQSNGIYDVTLLGSGSTSWVLSRSEDSDGSPTSEMRGGNVVTVNEPVPSMRVLTGTGSFLMTDPVLGNNDAILWTTYGSATIPLDLYTDTMSVGSGGVNGDLAVIRGSDGVVMISLDGSTGHIVAASITTPALTTLAGDVLLLQGAMLTATTANTAQGSAIAANTGSHNTLAAAHTTLDTDHTATLASLAKTHALTLGHATYITAHAAAGNPHGVSAATVGLGSCDNTADRQACQHGGRGGECGTARHGQRPRCGHREPARGHRGPDRAGRVR
jgi:hypothetical protein